MQGDSSEDQILLRRERQKNFTAERKLLALAHRFYQGAIWKPRSGDFYTLTRAGVELFQIDRIENGEVYIVKCDVQPERPLNEPFPEEGFTAIGFGVHRTHVPDFIFNI